LDTHEEEDFAASILGKRKGAEWDQATREKTMEEFFNAFVSRVSQAGQESFGLKETVELYKSRGECGYSFGLQVF
jgi:kinesin family protein C1